MGTVLFRLVIYYLYLGVDGISIFSCFISVNTRNHCIKPEEFFFCPYHWA